MLDYHHLLIADERRTNAFRDAIFATVKPGDVVVDIGTGSGILAFFACQAGARRVFAIEQLQTAGVAQFMTRHLGLDDRLQILKGRSTSLELPEPADVLTSETLGAFAFEEHILGIVVDARQRLLRPDARMIPRTVGLMVAPLEHPGGYASHVNWWRRPHYGLDFSPLATFASNFIYVEDIDPADLLGDASRVVFVDLPTLTTPEAEGTTTLHVKRDGTLHGFVGWFDATLADGIRIDNPPPTDTTWNQAYLPLEEPVAVRAGTQIDIRLQTWDGARWSWSGTIHTDPPTTFDQTTVLAVPSH